MVKTVKGQVSLEYLMTYGIAIAIVVIAVAALYSMGVFSPSSTTTVPPCTPCFSDFAYNAHTYNGTHLLLELKNGVTKINSVSCTSPSGCSVSSPTVDPNTVFTVRIPGNGTADVSVTLSFKKEGSDITITRTETISKNYFS